MNNFNIAKYRQLCKYEFENFKKCNENRNGDKHYCEVLKSLYMNCKHFKQIKEIQYTSKTISNPHTQ